MKRVALVLAIALAPRVAGAEPQFQSAVQTTLGLPSPPDCSLCHSGPESASTANTAFASALKCRGVRAGSTPEIVGRAASEIASQQPKVAEALRSDDVVAANAAFVGDPCAGASDDQVQYGCATARGGAGSALVSALLVAGALFATRRRRSAS